LVDGKQTRARRIGFLPANVVRSMQQLPVKIAQINRVLIHDSEGSNAAAARYSAAGEPSPPAPMHNTRASFNLR